MAVMYMCGHDMFILNEAKTIQTEEEIRDFRGGRRIKFFWPMKVIQQASNLNHPVQLTSIFIHTSPF